jgi:polysaccharide biosynthesis transport protein
MRTSSAGGQSTVTIGQFLGTLKRQFVLVLICLLLGVALSAALLARTPKSYQSTAVVDITPTLPTSSGSNNGVNTITEAKIATSSSVALSAAKKLGFAGTPTDLAQHVSVTSPLSSQVLNITFTSSSAQGAADGANAFAQSYLDYRTATAQADLQLRISRINDQITALQQKAKTGSTSSQISQLLTQLNSYRTVVVTPGQVAGIAAVPSSPSSPKPALYLAAGLLVGLLLGALLALVRDLRDDRVRGKADLEPSLGAPVIAEATSAEVAGKAWPRALVTLAEPRGHEADAYRTVATTVSADAAESQIVMLCSTGREGRSLAPMNLAATYALQGLRTVLAGPRAALEPVTGLLGIAELATVPTDRLAEQLIASDTVPGLFVLPLGDEVTIGATLRGNDDQLEEMLAETDVIVLDGVNIELPSTSLRLGQLADEVVVLVYANRTTHLDLERLAQHLAQVRASISGAILLRRQSWLRRHRRPRARTAIVALPARSGSGNLGSKSPSPLRTGQPGRRREPSADGVRGGDTEQLRPVSGAAKGR